MRLQLETLVAAAVAVPDARNGMVPSHLRYASNAMSVKDANKKKVEWGEIPRSFMFLLRAIRHHLSKLRGQSSSGSRARWLGRGRVRGLRSQRGNIVCIWCFLEQIIPA